MITFKTISALFARFLDHSSSESAGDQSTGAYGSELERLIVLSMQTNKTLWELEDSARMSELGDAHVANAKRSIDRYNQLRHDLIRQIDSEVVNRMEIVGGPKEKLYSETPGMIIDRLAIIFIRASVLRVLLNAIAEHDLREEYREKEAVVAKQIEDIGSFLDLYFKRLANKEVFFQVQHAIKIYNDSRLKRFTVIARARTSPSC